MRHALVRPACNSPVSNGSTDCAEGAPWSRGLVCVGQAATSPIALGSQRLREDSASGPQPIDGQDVDSIVGDVAPAAEVKDEPSGEGRTEALAQLGQGTEQLYIFE